MTSTDTLVAQVPALIQTLGSLSPTGFSLLQEGNTNHIARGALRQAGQFGASRAGATIPRALRVAAYMDRSPAISREDVSALGASVLLALARTAAIPILSLGDHDSQRALLESFGFLRKYVLEATRLSGITRFSPPPAFQSHPLTLPPNLAGPFMLSGLTEEFLRGTNAVPLDPFRLSLYSQQLFAVEFARAAVALNTHDCSDGDPHTPNYSKVLQSSSTLPIPLFFLGDTSRCFSAPPLQKTLVSGLGTLLQQAQEARRQIGFHPAGRQLLSRHDRQPYPPFKFVPGLALASPFQRLQEAWKETASPIPDDIAHALHSSETSAVSRYPEQQSDKQWGVAVRAANDGLREEGQAMSPERLLAWASALTRLHVRVPSLRLIPE